MTTLTTIQTAECQDMAIRLEAEKSGLGTLDILASNGKTGDARVTVYRVGDVLVAATNGDPVWREDDGEAFAALMAEEQIAIDQIDVVGIGDAFDLPDDIEIDRDMEWYGTVIVAIDGRRTAVGAVIGVPESGRGSARASGVGAGRPYLTAWYADSSDWESARPHAVPQDLARDVIEAIAGAAPRLWREIKA